MAASDSEKPGSFTVRELSDKTRILSFLESDRLYAAYAIGDLEPAMFAQCVWTAAERSGRVQALALHFRGLRPPALFIMGATGGLRAIFDAGRYSDGVYLTCRPEHLDVTRAFFRWDETVPMWRMALHETRFFPKNLVSDPLPSVHRDCIRLTPVYADQLSELYTLGGGAAFSPAQMQNGVFYGIMVDGRLVAVAGTHVVSPAYGVAALGNIFTHPDHRGWGYATVTTSAVVAELFGRGISDIVLNVAQDNETAIHVYEKLGFRRHCPFFEGYAALSE
jgi:ribosomal protein S18 acetylase RimI-like enzyme